MSLTGGMVSPASGNGALTPASAPITAGAAIFLRAAARSPTFANAAARLSIPRSLSASSCASVDVRSAAAAASCALRTSAACPARLRANTASRPACCASGLGVNCLGCSTPARRAAAFSVSPAASAACAARSCASAIRCRKSNARLGVPAGFGPSSLGNSAVLARSAAAAASAAAASACVIALPAFGLGRTGPTPAMYGGTFKSSVSVF